MQNKSKRKAAKIIFCIYTLYLQMVNSRYQKLQRQIAGTVRSVIEAEVLLQNYK